ncbi:MAG: hypothetical protein ACREKH_01830 [Candidatus Rokuibacteriota bacterium]
MLFLFNAGALAALAVGWLRGTQEPMVVWMLATTVSAVALGGLSLAVGWLSRRIFVEAASVADRRRVAALLVVCGVFGAVCSWLFLTVLRLDGG